MFYLNIYFILNKYFISGLMTTYCYDETVVEGIQMFSMANTTELPVYNPSAVAQFFNKTKVIWKFKQRLNHSPWKQKSYAQATSSLV